MIYPSQPELVYYPHPVLRAPCAAVTDFDDELAQFVEQMFLVMEQHHGVGLAAPQVGVSAQIFITDHAAIEDGDLHDKRVWINLRLRDPHGESEYNEGCLSLPNLYGHVTRHNSFDPTYQDLSGAEHTIHLDAAAGEFLATVVQHELDHLHGKLFVDHVSPVTLGTLRKKLKELERTYKKATGKVGAPLRR